MTSLKSSGNCKFHSWPAPLTTFSSAPGTDLARRRAAGRLATSRDPHSTSVGTSMSLRPERKSAAAISRSIASQPFFVIPKRAAVFSGSSRITARCAAIRARLGAT